MLKTDRDRVQMSGRKRRKPWAALRFYRAVQLQAIAGLIRNYHCTGVALQRLHDNFASELEQFANLADVGWWQILAVLLNAIEQANWFEADWELLNQAWAYWEHRPEDDGQLLASYLYHIPVKLHGFSPADRLKDRPIELMYALFSDEVEAVSADLLIAIEFYDNDLEEWCRNVRSQAWQRLLAIETDPGRYPEPVRWLPELVRWACGKTGNFILDRPASSPYLHLSWDQLLEVKTA